MKNCAFLSMDNIEDFECYDYLLDEPLAQLGWKTHTVSWRDVTTDWNRFDAVLIRSPWDYQQQADEFIAVLKRIDASRAELLNPLPTVLWNINKSYLQELQQKGIPVVPTSWENDFDPTQVDAYFECFSSNEIIIKPLVSANADNTFRLTRERAQQQSSELSAIFSQRDFMLQPFMQSVIDEGEFSLFFFGGEYSHAILKTPAQNDFRVQEEHGGTLLKIEPEAALLTQATAVNRLLSPAPLYSRIDLVRSQHGFAVMEVELIEPSLYFNMDQHSAQRFAHAYDQWMSQKHSVGV